MSRVGAGVIYALVMVALIVGVDLLFLRDLPVARLIVNVAMVLLFGVVYLRFFRR